jgi:hypothetical protein
MLLRNVPNIKISGTIKVTNRPVDWKTMFRVWNYSREDMSCDSIYSPILHEGQIVPFEEVGGSANDLIDKFYNALPYPYVVAECKFEYDFIYAPVNLEYETDGEMQYFFNLVNSCLKSTGLSVFLMLSHFKQLANKKGKLKPEHYHILIPQTNDDDSFERGIYFFNNSLKKEKIIRKIIVEVE